MSVTQVRDFWPHLVYVSAEACDDALTHRVLARLPQAQVVYLADGRDPLSEVASEAESFGSDGARFSAGKRRLLITRHHGSWLGYCPGTSQHVCCNLWIVNPGEGCPLDCTYCYLQAYLRRNPTMKLYSNTDDMLREIEQAARAQPDRLFRVCTGEVMDSLVWDELTDLTRELVPFFARLPNVILELKSKFAEVDNLIALKNEHRGKTVVSWSINARSVTAQDEAYTSSLDERLCAARRVADAGYRVGLHLDPLIHFPGWEEEYRRTVADVFAYLKPSELAWVSLSTLRYKREMQSIMKARFPQSRMLYGEHFLAKDDKLRYIQPIRFKILTFLWSELKKWSETLPVYMCMESSAAWHQIAAGPPAAGDELIEVFSKRGRLPIIAQNMTVSAER